MRMLILPIKKKWYDMISSGEKLEEYREIKSYYDVRFKDLKPGDTVKFINGYGNLRPFIIKEIVSIEKGIGNPEWGAPDFEVYKIKIK